MNRMILLGIAALFVVGGLVTALAGAGVIQQTITVDPETGDKYRTVRCDVGISLADTVGLDPLGQVSCERGKACQRFSSFSYLHREGDLFLIESETGYLADSEPVSINFLRLKPLLSDSTFTLTGCSARDTFLIEYTTENEDTFSKEVTVR